MSSLRDYQTEAIAAVWSEFRTYDDALLVFPTGLGKTHVFLHLAKKAIDSVPEARVMVLLNKVALVEQTYKRATDLFFLCDVGQFCGSRGEYDDSKRVTVASVQSMALQDQVPHIDFLILDEAHRATTEEDSSYATLIARLREKNPKIKILGATATPFRATGRIYGKPDSLFRRITYQKSLNWAIEQGHLAPPRIKHTQGAFSTAGIKVTAGDFNLGELEKRVMDKDKIARQIKEALPRLEGRNKVVWACTSINHAEAVAALLPGSSLIHSRQALSERARQIEAFESGGNRHLVFVTIVSEGYDFPPIDAVVLMRPTKSALLYIQTVGRGLRLSPGKNDCVVLDFGRVVENCGTLDDPRIVEGGRRQKDVPAPLMKFCELCFEYLPFSAKVCTACGKEFPVREPTKNLTVKAWEGDILTREEWIEITDVQVAPHKAKSNRPCLTITYVPKDWAKLPIREYAVFDDKAHWMNRRASEKLARFGLELKHPTKVKEWMAQNFKWRPEKIPTKIKVKFGRYPEVLEVA